MKGEVAEDDDDEVVVVPVLVLLLLLLLPPLGAVDAAAAGPPRLDGDGERAVLSLGCGEVKRGYGGTARGAASAGA